MENNSNTKTLAFIKDLIDNSQYDRALNICKEPRYHNDENIQAERMFILDCKLKSTDEAYAVWSYFQTSDNLNIIIAGINILMHKQELDRALEYANKHKCDNLRYMRLRVKLLTALNEKEEINEIMKNPVYSTDAVIRRMASKLIREDKEIKDEISEVLTRLYVDNITKEKIKDSNIDFYSQSILLLAYYEKYNIKAGLDLIKQLKRNDNINPDYKKIYNKVEQRLRTKNNYFDITFYSNLVNRSIDFELASKYEQEKEKEEIPVIKTNVVNTVKTNNDVVTKNTNNESKRVIKYAEVIGNRVNSRFNNTNSNTNGNTNNQKHTLLIKDVLYTEINELGMYLYVMMQETDTKKNAIKAWDNLERMIYKSVEDRVALEKVIKILSNISKEHPEIVNADSKKLTKLLEK